MTTQYSPILKLALPVQGELSGTWGDVVNDNITSMVEQAIAGRAVINTWTTNSHTLTSANGTTSESRCAMLELTDTGTALSGAGTVVCPTASKIYIVKNAAGQNITVKTSGGTGILVPNGRTTFLFCDGTNVVEALTHTTSLQLGTSTTVTAVLDEDNMASDSATSLATQQSIKAYVDSKVGQFDSLSEVLAVGNTTGSNNIIVDNGQKITTNTIDETTAGSGVTIDSVLLKDDVVNATDVETGSISANDGTTAATIANSTGVVTVPSAVLTTADINGGTADGVVIGGTTPAAATVTTAVANTSLTIAGTTTVTSILDEDNMASDDPAGLATQQSIKAYVDAQVGTVDTLAEVLANGNTTGGTNISITSGDKIVTGSNDNLVLEPGGTGNVNINSDTLAVSGAEGESAALVLSADEADDNPDIWRIVSNTGNTLGIENQISGSAVSHLTITPNATVANSTFAVAGTVTSAGLTVDSGSTSASIDINSSQHSASIANTSTLNFKFAHSGSPDATGYIKLTENGINSFDGSFTFGVPNNNGSGGSQTTKAMEIKFNNDITFYDTDGTTASFVYDADAGTTFNDAGADRDFQVKSDNNANMFGVDASGDTVFVYSNTLASGNDGSLLVDSDDEKHHAIKIRAGTGVNGISLIGDNYKADETQFTLGLSYSSSNVVLARGVKPSDTTDNTYLSSQDTYVTAPSALVLTNFGMQFLSTTVNTTNTTDSAVSLYSYFEIDENESVFNEFGGNRDFRVESDANTHMLFVDAGNDYIGIDTSNPVATLVVSNGGASGIEFQPEISSNFNRITNYNRSANVYNELGIDAARIEIRPEGVRRLSVATSGVIVNEDSRSDTDFRVESDGNANMLFVDAGNDRVGIGAAPSNPFEVNAGSGNAFIYTTGVTALVAQADAAGDTLILQTTDTTATNGPNIKFRRVATGAANDGLMQLGVNGFNDTGTEETQFFRQRHFIIDASNGTEDGAFDMFNMIGGTLRSVINHDSTATIFNDNSVDIDFRVESDNKTHMLFIDAAENAIGINNSDPKSYPSGTQTGSATDAGQFRIGGSVGAVCAADTGNELAWTRSGLNYISSPNGGFRIRAGTSGGVNLSTTATSWTSASDERLKTLTGDIENAAEKVKTLRTKMGRYNEDPEDVLRPFLIAQDVQAVLPEAVSVIEDDPEIADTTGISDKLFLSYTDVIPLLTAALKESIAKNEELEARITALENA